MAFNMLTVRLELHDMLKRNNDTIMSIDVINTRWLSWLLQFWDALEFSI